jgi:hypothetical protein
MHTQSAHLPSNRNRNGWNIAIGCNSHTAVCWNSMRLHLYSLKVNRLWHQYSIDSNDHNGVCTIENNGTIDHNGV